MANAVVVGGAGFVGSHLTERLIQEGWNVLVVDKDRDMDMGDPRLKEVFQGQRPNVVFHLAGPIQLRRSDIESSFSLCASLLAGTKNLLDAARMAGVQKIVFSSSGGAVYEKAQEIPTPETYPASSSSLYGSMTLLLEQLMQDYGKTYGLPLTILRLSNVYGPGQWENVIRRFTEAMKRDEPPTIEGDGSSTRDYVYIDDVVEAFWKAANSQATGVFNIGSSKETSLREVFEAIADVLQWNGEPQYAAAGQQTVSRNALDCAKAKEKLGWQPSVSLSEGIRRTVTAMN